MKRILLFSVLLALCLVGCSQPEPSFCPCWSDTARTRTLRVCFYNLENFFDCVDDSLTNDNEFLPEGTYHWDTRRYYHKADQIAKVLVAAGGWDYPDIVGLAEVENSNVLKTLVFKTILKKARYRYVHFDSPDPRGIDVALLYRPERFQLCYAEPVAVKFSFQPGSSTRDILYVKGIAKGSSDTLHLFVNHFTSRYAGYKATEHKRMHIATVLRGRIDSILNLQTQACVLVMGDFNDTPADSSMRYGLRATLDAAHVENGDLINLMYPYVKQGRVGTHKYHRHWSVLDQFVVTPSLTMPDAPYRVASPVCIFAAPFMLEKDEKYLGDKPLRTYVGRDYKGGFSDHLPIVLDLSY